jgi:N-acetyl sugar amidotransferase
MDTTDLNITFNEQGVCNHCIEYERDAKFALLPEKEAQVKLKEILDTIKKSGKGKKYDSILGISGGTDSSYLTYLAKEFGLRPLIVHFDNGWNSELAVQNIENIVSRCGYDLYTFVMDWEEFKDLQRSYFKASVLDLEVPTDHMIFGALYKIARKHNIKYVLSGNNYVTETVLPKSWYYNKFDFTNIRSIHKKFGTVKLKKLPKLGFWHYTYYQLFCKMKLVLPLNYINYNKKEAQLLLKDKFDWRDYGGKHYESIFTRFYQGYILPTKFNIDKRKAHLSTLICSGQISRQEALEELNINTYSKEMQMSDKEYVAKKLGFTLNEFEEVLNLPNRKHEEYGTDRKLRDNYFKFMKILKPFTRIVKKIKKN